MRTLTLAIGAIAMTDLLKKLFDPKFQILVVGVLSVVAGVTEYLVGNDFIQGYPEVAGVVVAINGAVLVALKVAQSLFNPLRKRGGKQL